MNALWKMAGIVAVVISTPWNVAAHDDATEGKGALGKVSFGLDQLRENADALIHAVLRAKPAAAKGKYVKSATISSTMGPGIKLDESLLALAEA